MRSLPCIRPLGQWLLGVEFFDPLVRIIEADVGPIRKCRSAATIDGFSAKAPKGRDAMLIGILSDTHDQVARASRAVRKLADLGAEALIHCGDLTGPEVVHECVGLPAYFVFGNNDYNQVGLRRAMDDIGAVCLGVSGTVTLGGRRLAVTHGDSTKEMKRLAALAPDYLFFGHTHVPTDERVGPTRWVNPGALYRAPAWTVALLDLEGGSLRLLTIDHAR